MAQLIVRNIEDSVKKRLKQRAEKNRRSMEDEVRETLRNSAFQEDPRRGLGTEIASLFRKNGLDADIPELRGHALQAPKFDE
jgi:antitoxin FitA